MIIITLIHIHILLSVQSIYTTQHTLSTFVRTVIPITTSDNYHEIFQEKLTKPGVINRLYIKHTLYQALYCPGIIAAYGGFVTQSDSNGQITFPLLSENNSIRLVFTPKIRPIIFRGSTVAFFTIHEHVPVRVIRAKRLYNTEEKVWYWSLQEEELSPKRELLPLDLIFFVNPKHVILPDENIVTHDDANLLLPDIYVTHKIKTAFSALHFIKASNYFKPVHFAYRKTADRYAFQVTNV